MTRRTRGPMDLSSTTSQAPSEECHVTCRPAGACDAKLDLWFYKHAVPTGTVATDHVFQSQFMHDLWECAS